MHCRYDAGERSWRYCLGAVGDGDAGVAVGELVVAGAWDSTVSLRGQNTAATTITTTSTAIAYKKRLSPKKFIITSRNRPRPICGRPPPRKVFCSPLIRSLASICPACVGALAHERWPRW